MRTAPHRLHLVNTFYIYCVSFRSSIKHGCTCICRSHLVALSLTFTFLNFIGDKAIDNHLTPSTLAGETAEQVDRFRQLRYKEYNEICRLCKENSVPLSEGLLKKGREYMVFCTICIRKTVECWFVLVNSYMKQSDGFFNNALIKLNAKTLKKNKFQKRTF